MTFTAQHIFDVLEAWAPPRIQESWDNCGCLVGEPQSPVDSALLCLDCTEAVVDEAVARGIPLIISHHPLIFGGLKHLRGETAGERAVIKAVRHRLVVYAAHTNADKVFDGVSAAMAQKLGLQNPQPLAPEVPVPDGRPCGLGLVGELPQALPPAAFLAQVARAFGLRHFRYSGPEAAPEVQRVALCGGSGGSLIDRALAAGAQAYVSADFSYHRFLDTADRILLADIGHHESEVGVLELFKNLLNKNLPTFAVHTTNTNTNPIYYY